MYDSCLEKQQKLLSRFFHKEKQEQYALIIDMGKELPPFPPSQKKASNLVEGCQSALYLFVENPSKENFTFNIDSESMISKGLGALLVAIYNGEPAQTLLQCPPTCLEKLHLSSLLSFNRSSGLNALLLRLKKEALSTLCF
mgnify:CR=1 FL=1